MGHTFTKCFFHCVFATRGRRQLIPADLQTRLWPFMGGIARQNECTVLAAGGTADHAHVLLHLPAKTPVSKAVQLIKAGSSKWLRETFPVMNSFAWQEGYAAFTIGVSQVEDTQRYIARQAEHHRTQPFADELRAFLRRHGFEEPEALRE